MQALSAFKMQKTPEGGFNLDGEPLVGWDNKWHHDRLGYASACKSICASRTASKAAWRKLAYAWAIPSQQIMFLLNDAPCLHGHGAGSTARTGCGWIPLPVICSEERGSWKHCGCRAGERENFLFRFCLAQQPYIQMGPRATRDTLQFQPCSCESLITARTGERLCI